ncbi:MAG: ATP-binding cassette domain-containing protein [Planctomycetota bacterium]
MVQTATATGDTKRQTGDTIVAAQGLTKVFKDFWMRSRVRAVDGVDFHIERGEIFGLLGPNGSGKSTSIKMILGLLKKTSGRLSVFGKSPFEVDTKKRIGYLPEESYLYPFLTARETLDYYGKLFKLDGKTRAKRTDELLDMVGLMGVQHRQVREFSKGMQRRIGLAQALINDPEFLILDEPTTGLDPIGTRQVKELILALGKRGKTILLSSHLLADVEDCVDRMVILYGGKVREEGTCDTLLRAQEKSVVQTDRLDPRTIEEIRQVLERNAHRLDSVEAPRQRLEDLFVSIVERARTENISTSGATNAGQTAAFLAGDAEAQAERLIDDLVASEEPAVPAGEAPMPVEAPRDAEQEAADELIDDLINEAKQPEPVAPDPALSEPAAQAPSPERRPAPAAPTDADATVDDDVISSLLADSQDEDNKK